MILENVLKDVLSDPDDKPMAFMPYNLPNLAAWYKHKQNIIVTGSGVSKWGDSSGNGRHLLQGTDANRPTLNGDKSILFDGTAHVLKANSFTFNQPETIYLLLKMVSWTLSDYIFDGNTTGLGRLLQQTTTPGLIFNAGTSLTQNNDLAVGAYGVVSVVVNGASSSLQINKNTPTTGNAGANNMGGFTLGRAGGLTGWSNIEVKEVILFSAAHDANTRTKVIEYLAKVGGLTL